MFLLLTIVTFHSCLKKKETRNHRDLSVAKIVWIQSHGELPVIKVIFHVNEIFKSALLLVKVTFRVNEIFKRI